RARLLRDGARPPVLRECGDAASALQDAGVRPRRAGGMGERVVRLGYLRPIARLCDLRGVAVLPTDGARTLRATRASTRRGATGARAGLSLVARAVRAPDRTAQRRSIDRETAVQLARARHRGAWYSGLRGVAHDRSRRSCRSGNVNRSSISA